jgi:hypothetical protein
MPVIARKATREMFKVENASKLKSVQHVNQLAVEMKCTIACAATKYVTLLTLLAFDAKMLVIVKMASFEIKLMENVLKKASVQHLNQLAKIKMKSSDVDAETKCAINHWLFALHATTIASVRLATKETLKMENA